MATKRKLWSLDDEKTVTTTTGKTYKMSQVGTKNYTVNQKKAAENKAAMAKAEQVHKQAQQRSATNKVNKSLLSMPEMTDYTKEKVQPDKYDTRPGTLPRVTNALRRFDNAGASVLAKQIGSREAAIKTQLSNAKERLTYKPSDRYKAQMNKLTSIYGNKAKAMPLYKQAELSYNNALKNEKVRSNKKALKATEALEDSERFKNAALDGLTGKKRTIASGLIGAANTGADLGLMMATPLGTGAALMGLSAAGEKSRQTALQGGTLGQTAKAGALSGGISAGINTALPVAFGKVGALSAKGLTTSTLPSRLMTGTAKMTANADGYLTDVAKTGVGTLAKNVLSNAAKEGIKGAGFSTANYLGQNAADAILGEQVNITPKDLATQAGTGFIMGAGLSGINGAVNAVKLRNAENQTAKDFMNWYNSKVYANEESAKLRRPTPPQLGTRKGTVGERIVNEAKNLPLRLPKGTDFVSDSKGNIRKFETPTGPINTANEKTETKILPTGNKIVKNEANAEDFEDVLFSPGEYISKEEIGLVGGLQKTSDNIGFGDVHKMYKAANNKLEKEIKKEAKELATEFKAYKPAGVATVFLPSDDRSAVLGMRPKIMSKGNEEWYSAFYKKYKHKPSKKGLETYADDLVREDMRKGGGTYASPELADLYNTVSNINRIYEKAYEGQTGRYVGYNELENGDFSLNFGSAYEGLAEPKPNEPYPVYNGRQKLVNRSELQPEVKTENAAKQVMTDNAAQKELLAQKSTVKADYSKFNPEILKSTNAARKNFIDYAKENFPESVTVKSNGMKVDISRKGLDKLLSGKILKEKYASAFYVPELLENAYGAVYSKYNKPYGKTKENIDGYTYMKSNINIDGEPYIAHIRVRHANDKKSYYGHTLSGTIDDIKIEPPDADGHSTSTTSWPVITADDSNQSISNNGLDVNGKSTISENLSTYGKGTVGAAEANPESINSRMEELSGKYGSMPYGEEPRARVDNIPKSTDGKTKVSQFARNMIEAEVTPEPFVQELEKSIIKGEFSHKVVTDRKSLEKAEEIVSGGYEKALDYWNTRIDTGARLDKTDMAVAMELYNQAANTGDVQTAMKLAGDMASIETLSGQIVQAARMLKKMTPDANLYSLEQTINRLNKNAPKGREIKLNEELARNLLKSKSTEEMTKNVRAIRKDISSQMDASIIDTINEWRYFAMLANPRTHIRNIVGNVTTNMLYRTKDVVGMALENGVNAVAKKAGYEGVDKTKSIMSPLKSETDKKLISYAKENYENNMKGVATGESKVHDSQTELYRDRNVFAQNPIGRALSKITGGKSNTLANLLDKATKGNTRLLEVEDNIAIKNKYVDSFAKYMKANKHTPEYYNSFEGQQALSKAQDYALQQALESTFHDDSKIADALIKVQKTNKLTDITIGTLFPFKKTPINVAKRGVEFSPIGLAKGTYDFGKSIKAAKQTRNLGNSEMSKAIDELAKGLTGSGLMALGIALAYKGYINSGLSDDDKVSGLEKAEGKQKFALNLLDGTTVTLDSFSPSVIPVLAGAGLYEEYTKGGSLSAGDVVDMISALDSPLIEMSFLSSVNDAITDLKYGGDDPVPTIASSVAKNYAGSMMPTLLSAIGNTVDDTKRSSSYIDKNSKYGKTVQGIMNQATYKNPVTHSKLPPSLDVWGREQKTKSAAVRAVNNFLNPTTVKKKNITAVDKEVERLYKSTGDSEVIPSLPNKYMNYKNTQGNQVRKDFTANEYTKYVKERNNATLKDIDGLIKTQEYKNLSDEDKAKVISGLFDYNNDKAKGDLAKDYEIQKSTAKIDDIVASTGMSKANAILYRQTLSNMDKGGKDADEINDYLFNNNSLTAQQKNKLSQEYVKDYVFVNRQKDIDFSNKESYEASKLSESGQSFYNNVKQKGYTLEIAEKALDIMNTTSADKGREYKKTEKLADMRKQLGLTKAQAEYLWNAKYKKK